MNVVCESAGLRSYNRYGRAKAKVHQGQGKSRCAQYTSERLLSSNTCVLFCPSHFLLWYSCISRTAHAWELKFWIYDPPKIYFAKISKWKNFYDPMIPLFLWFLAALALKPIFSSEKYMKSKISGKFRAISKKNKKIQYIPGPWTPCTTFGYPRTVVSDNGPP